MLRELTGNAGTKGDESHRGDGILDSQGAAEVGCDVTDHRRHHADPEYADDEAQVAAGEIWNSPWCCQVFAYQDCTVG